MTGETIAIIALGTPLTAAVVALIALTWKLLGYHSTLQAMDDERDKAIVRAERLEFELALRTDALAKAERTIDALAKEPHETPNSDLPAGDIISRVRRAAEEARASRTGEVPSGAEATAMYSPSAGSGSDAAEVPHDPDGLLQPD